ncbi:colicin-like pore-forming protein [Enterobacter sp. 186315]
MAGENSIGGGSQFGNMGPNDPYGSGGGSSGNNKPGGNSGGNGSSGGTSGTPAQKKQASDIRNDPVIRQKLVELTRKAQLMNSAAKVSIDSISATGVMEVSITGLDVSQASTIGLSGLIGLKTVAGNFTFGKIETGHKIPGTGQQHGSAVGNLVSEAVEEENKKNSKPSLEDRVNKYYSDRPSRKALMNLYKEMLRTGKIPAAARGNLLKSLQSMLTEDKKLAAVAAENKKNEADALLQASDIISDVGEKVSKTLGNKYNLVAKDIAGNIKKFQGKNIRNFNDAMKSLNKLISNPNMKINQADKNALINAWKHVNASDMANKLGNLSKGFNIAGTVLKIEKVREKSIVGYETGNWGPLVLEVESWIVSGVAGSIALGLFSAIVGSALLSAGVSLTIVGIMGIIVAVIVSSMIDDKLVDKINNEIVRPAH